jgi:hypothetical protein
MNQIGVVEGANEVVMESTMGGIVWKICVVGTLICLALLYFVIPPNSFRDGAFAVTLLLIAAFGAFLTHVTFKARHDTTRYYRDRVETTAKGKLAKSLPYTDVRFVAYGFRGDNDQFLAFSGEGKSPRFSLHFGGIDKHAKPTDVTTEKALALRDELYEVVVQQMLTRAESPSGAQWFADLRLTADAILSSHGRHPLQEVTIDANERNGQVKVRHGKQDLGHTSMIEDNVVAGLIAIDRLRGT